ncbi:hypothetical protein [Teredinibacter purpureus]|uniref:hypothetical protein n=1 Tax=Teredinibacter purpureus TaxID=2731756 RepID=UPI0013C48AC3|nr:hypothetical protein [Teredinibacter purpureus]
MKNITLILLAFFSLNTWSQETEEVETREVPVELLNELHAISQMFVYEGIQNSLDRAAQAHLFYILAKNDDPIAMEVVLRATLQSMKADIELVLESGYSKEHQKKRAQKMLDELYKSGVFKK